MKPDAPVTMIMRDPVWPGGGVPRCRPVPAASAAGLAVRRPATPGAGPRRRHIETVLTASMAHWRGYAGRLPCHRRGSGGWCATRAEPRTAGAAGPSAVGRV